MNVLIIYAHPNPESFNAAILNKIHEGIKESGNSVKVLDLYTDNFDPVLRFDAEHKRRFLATDPETEKYRNLLNEADHVIFIYPIWWYGMPAILKGFIDRVFASGYAYKFDGNIPKGLLKGKNAWVVYTMDSPSLYAFLFRGSMEWNNMKDAILKFCGFNEVKRFMFGNVKGSSIEQRKKWLDYLYNKAKNI